eukprot:1059025-Rhodomonas_salina.2
MPGTHRAHRASGALIFETITDVSDKNSVEALANFAKENLGMAVFFRVPFLPSFLFCSVTSFLCSARSSACLLYTSPSPRDRG